jgi:hypothetical protein
MQDVDKIVVNTREAMLKEIQQMGSPNSLKTE